MLHEIKRKPNEAYRTREHLTAEEIEKLLAALKNNRHGLRDWLIGLLIYRHGLRVSEACELRWDNIDLSKRIIIVRRMMGSVEGVHELARDEVCGLQALKHHYEARGVNSGYVFINERSRPFDRTGIASIVRRAGETAELCFPVHVLMLRHSIGYALAAKGMDMRRLQRFLGHASITSTVRYGKKLAQERGSTKE